MFSTNTAFTSSLSTVFAFAPVSNALRISSEAIHDSAMGVENTQ